MSEAEDRIRILKKMATDEAFFSKMIFPDHIQGEVPRFHGKIYRLLNSALRLIALAAPRGHAKSTTTCLIHVLYRALNRRSRFIVIISASKPAANLFLDAIKTEIEFNEALHYWYGHLKSHTKWTQDDIELVFDQTDPRQTVKILSKGAGQQMRGLKFQNQRPDLMILDDIEDEENTATKEQREKLQNWFNGAVLPARSPNGQICVIGTIPHYDSLLWKLCDPSIYPDFDSHIFACHDGDGADIGEPLWAERFPQKKLRKMRDSFAARGMLHMWAQEMMNQPMNEELRVFKHSYRKNYSGYVVHDPEGRAWLVLQEGNTTRHVRISIFVGVDLAISQKKWADYTAIAVLGIDKDNNAYLLEMIRERMDPFQTVEALFDVNARYRPRMTAIEAQSYQMALIMILEQEMRKRNDFFPVMDVIQDHDKERRILALQPRFAQQAFLWRTSEAGFEAELFDWPKTKHDDQLDAIEIGLRIADRPVGEADIHQAAEMYAMPKVSDYFGEDDWKTL